MTDTTIATDAFFEDIATPRRDAAIARFRAARDGRGRPGGCGCNSMGRKHVMLVGAGLLGGIVLAKVMR